MTLTMLDVRIERECFEYLDNLGYSLWANWEVQDIERRRVAGRWWALHTTALIDQMTVQDLAMVLGASRWRLFVAWWDRKTTRFRRKGTVGRADTA